MNNRSDGPATSARSTSTSGSTPASRVSISVCRAVTIILRLLNKKSGRAPTFGTAPDPPAGKAVSLSLAPGTARGWRGRAPARSRGGGAGTPTREACAAVQGARARRLTPRRPARPARGSLAARAGSVPVRLGRPGTRPVAVHPVVPAARLQARRERERAPRLGVAAEQLQAPPQAEEREVVRRRAVDDRLELGGRLLVAPGAEQRAAERLADRRLVRLEVARPRERNHRLVVVATVEKLGAALEEVVDVVGCHASQW